MRRLRARLGMAALEVLAAIVGLGLVAGEVMDRAEASDDQNGGDQFPGQRQGGGTHFRERVERARLLGEFPGLRKMAAKLRQPRSAPSVLMTYTPANPNPGNPSRRESAGTRAAYDPAPGSQQDAGSATTAGGARAKADDGGDQFPWPTQGGGTQYRKGRRGIVPEDS